MNEAGGLLGHLAENGFNPTLIVDIGACIGEWGTMAARIFPLAQIVMIDGNPGAMVVDSRGEDSNRLWFITRIGDATGAFGDA